MGRWSAVVLYTARVRVSIGLCILPFQYFLTAYCKPTAYCIVSTRWHILKLKFTKFDFCWGSPADPAGGAYSALWLDFRGLLLRKKEEMGEDIG